ncbi:MAG: sulfur oxidation c-type cytochrome SoxX [Paracoccaceae bacterium]|nr:sulfur oxidation c-type cytochrome SoxX [Paracoccaceae bacterium]
MNRTMSLVCGSAQKWTAAITVGALAAASLMGPASAEVGPDDVKIDDGVVAQPIADQPGDAAAGREWASGRKLGNCLACHAISDLSELPFHGEVGPPLDGVADRWSAEELRAILVNSKTVFGDQTIMPAFYRTAGLNKVADDFAGKTILSAQQIEDIIAYLLTLKE